MAAKDTPPKKDTVTLDKDVYLYLVQQKNAFKDALEIVANLDMAKNYKAHILIAVKSLDRFPDK